MGVILVIIGILLAADSLAVMIMGFEIGAFFACVIGFILIFWGANYKSVKQWHGFLRFLKILMKIGLIYILAASCFLAVTGNISETNYAEDYAVVLGCGTRNGQPTKPLRQRLDKAVEYATTNENAVIIVSGGRGIGESAAEADVMYSYLVDKGISADRIVKESNSHNTYENFKLSNEAVNGALQETGTAVITNSFHIFRAKLYAKLCGVYAKACPAPTSIYYIPVYYVRESLALIKAAVYYIPGIGV